GDGTFGPPVFPRLADNQVFAVADFNGDGFPDLLVRLNNGIATELGNGDGTFKGPGQPVGILGSGYWLPLNLLIADFNKDGLPDVAWISGQEGAPDLFLSSGDGGFR